MLYIASCQEKSFIFTGRGNFNGKSSSSRRYSQLVLKVALYNASCFHRPLVHDPRLRAKLGNEIKRSLMLNCLLTPCFVASFRSASYELMVIRPHQSHLSIPPKYHQLFNNLSLDQIFFFSTQKKGNMSRLQNGSYTLVTYGWGFFFFFNPIFFIPLAWNFSIFLKSGVIK